MCPAIVSTITKKKKKRKKRRVFPPTERQKLARHVCTDCSLQRFNPIAEIPEEKFRTRGRDYLPLKERLTWRGDGNMQIA